MSNKSREERNRTAKKLLADLIYNEIEYWIEPECLKHTKDDPTQLFVFEGPNFPRISLSNVTADNLRDIQQAIENKTVSVKRRGHSPVEKTVLIPIPLSLIERYQKDVAQLVAEDYEKLSGRVEELELDNKRQKEEINLLREQLQAKEREVEAYKARLETAARALGLQ